MSRELLGVVGRRLANLAVLLLGVTTLLFFLLRVTGDPAAVIAGSDADAAQLEAVRAQYGLDRPLAVQFVAYLASVLRLDFGMSLSAGEPALGLVLERLPATLELAGVAMLLTLILAVPVGAWMGYAPQAPGRRVAAGIVFVLQGVPGYVVALIAIQIVAVEFRLLPSVGYGGPETFILPAVALASFLAPKLVRVIAANVTEAMAEDYIRTARSQGADGMELLWRHAVPNALLGATALVGTMFAALVSGAVVTEAIFAWPGIGWLLVTSTQTLDFPVVQALTFMVAILVFAVNTATDLAFALIDPRLRRQRA